MINYGEPSQPKPETELLKCLLRLLYLDIHVGQSKVFVGQGPIL